ncbi:hypothetical protein Leryth_010645 [Lithospermum erythrorhizon]|nr:hypothetical protein Leryth_010645 [Lithospermum erythrorhizon]
MEKIGSTKLYGLGHLFMTSFLGCFFSSMVIPAITDVTLAALCPGEDECSLAIYLTGVQQAVIGLGSVVTMPLLGNLSDLYGRKLLLTFPMTLSIFPLAILAYERTKYYFYAYYILRTLISMVCEGSVPCLALAYVADNVPESKRAAVFGILSGVASSAFVCGNLSARFLSTSATFQVAAGGSVVALVYMRAFLPESIRDRSVPGKATETDCLLEKAPSKKLQFFKTLPSFNDTICLLRTSPTFSQAAIATFFCNVAEIGLHASLLYYLKAQFQFDKDQFADLMIIGGAAGSISQLVLMPLVARFLGEQKLLSIGLFFGCAHMFLHSIAWASWVPYAAAMMSIVSTFAMPCLKSIASKQISPCEQGKAQGCLTGISSLASIVSPLVFSPLTAMFLSDNPPFYFPGFSIMCAGFAGLIAFIQSMRIKDAESVSDCMASSSDSLDP